MGFGGVDRIDHAGCWTKLTRAPPLHRVFDSDKSGVRLQQTTWMQVVQRLQQLMLWT